MARALELPPANTVLAAHPSLTFRMGAYTWTVETRNGQRLYKVSSASGSLVMPIHWSFGAQAQTWVFEQDGRFYESLVSFYPSANGLGITTGDERLTPQTLREAMGRELTSTDTKLCFGCHASDAVLARKLNLATLHPGVTCAHCHQGTSGHSEDASLGDFSSAPPRLQDMTAESISNFCGQCHRSWETVVRNGWRGIPDVRFQPYRLANSRCFNGTDSRISLHRVPRSPQGSHPRRRVLRSQMPRLPRSRRPPHQHRQSKDLSRRFLELRQLPHAESNSARRTSPLYRPPDSHRPKR